MPDFIDTRALIIVGIMSLITLILRVLPFLLFGGKRKVPEIVLWLGRVLPPAVIGMLLIYCFKDVSFSSAPFGIPELIAAAVVALLHLWKRNSLLSVGGGTICYMLLVQLIFV